MDQWNARLAREQSVYWAMGALQLATMGAFSDNFVERTLRKTSDWLNLPLISGVFEQPMESVSRKIRRLAAPSRLPLFLVCLLASGAGTAAVAQERVLGVEVDRINRVIDLGYNLAASTEAEIDELMADYPESPVPDLLKVGRLYWHQNYAGWDEELSEAFEEAADASLRKAKQYLKRHREDPDAAFVVALNEVVLVMFYVDQHRWWAAFWKARSSMKTMRHLVQRYPEEYPDAKMPLGIANCYSAETPAYLKPMSFLLRFGGDMELGLAYLKAAKDNGLFTRVDARYYLGAIQAELHEDWESSAKEYEILVERYPRNGRFHNVLTDLERKLGRDEAACERMQTLLEQESLSEFPAMRLRAMSNLTWTALASKRFELALETARAVQRWGKDDERVADYWPWARMAEAEALKALGRNEEALAAFESISTEDDWLQKTAQERIEELKDLQSETKAGEA